MIETHTQLTGLFFLSLLCSVSVSMRVRVRLCFLQTLKKAAEDAHFTPRQERIQTINKIQKSFEEARKRELSGATTVGAAPHRPRAPYLHASFGDYGAGTPVPVAQPNPNQHQQHTGMPVLQVSTLLSTPPSHSRTRTHTRAHTHIRHPSLSGSFIRREEKRSGRMRK